MQSHVSYTAEACAQDESAVLLGGPWSQSSYLGLLRAPQKRMKSSQARKPCTILGRRFSGFIGCVWFIYVYMVQVCAGGFRA